MFNRKVLLIALLAVVLLSSCADGSVTLEKSRKHRRRATEPAAGGIAQIVPCIRCVSLTNLMNQVASAIGAADLTNQQAARGDHKPRRRKAFIDPAGLTQIVSGVMGFDQASQSLAFGDRKKIRKPRAAIDSAGLTQVAGGIAGIDPT